VEITLNDLTLGSAELEGHLHLNCGGLSSVRSGVGFLVDVLRAVNKYVEDCIEAIPPQGRTLLNPEWVGLIGPTCQKIAPGISIAISEISEVGIDTPANKFGAYLRTEVVSSLDKLETFSQPDLDRLLWEAITRVPSISTQT
jgi:hypothetical protein